MAQYFLKYLPNKKPIAIGVLTTEGKVLSKLDIRDKTFWITDTKIDGVNVNIEDDCFQEHELKTIDLYVCSKNIKAGDKVFDKGDLNYPLYFKGTPENDTEIGEFLTEDNLFTYRNMSDVFKVIGEVSLSSLGYVKQGDEFDEGDLQFKLKKGDLAGHIFNLSNIKAFIGNSYQHAWVLIKGPCGHFH